MTSGARRMVRICALGSGSLAVVGIGCRVFGWGTLAPENGPEVPMRLATAGLILLLSLALWLRTSEGDPGHGRLFIASVALLSLLAGVLVLLRNALRIDLDWERWLAALFGPTSELIPERMSSLTALLFMLAGAGTLLQVRPFASHRELRHVSVGCAVVVLLAGGAVLLGYSYGIPFLPGTAMPAMAFLSAAGLALLGLGWLVAAGTDSWLLQAFVGPSLGSRVLRYVLPTVLVLSILQTWVSLLLVSWPGSEAPLVSGFLMGGYVGASGLVVWAVVRRTLRPVDRMRHKREYSGEEARWTHMAYTALTEIHRRANDALGEDELQLEVCRALAELAGFRLVCILRWDEKGHLLLPVSYSGKGGAFWEEIGKDPARSPAGWAVAAKLKSARQHVWNDLRARSEAFVWQEAAYRSGLRSAAAFFLRAGEKPWGLLLAFQAEPDAFRDRELALLETAVEHLELALEKMEAAQQRDKVESALRDSERRYHDLSRQVPGVTYQFRVSKDGKPYFAFISPRAADFGLSLDPQHPDWKLGARIHPDDRERFFASVAKSIMERTDWSFEGRGITPAGELKWIQAWSAIKVVNEELIYDGVFFDVTSQKQAEEKLRFCAQCDRRPVDCPMHPSRESKPSAVSA